MPSIASRTVRGRAFFLKPTKARIPFATVAAAIFTWAITARLSSACLASIQFSSNARRRNAVVSLIIGSSYLHSFRKGLRDVTIIIAGKVLQEIVPDAQTAKLG